MEKKNPAHRIQDGGHSVTSEKWRLFGANYDLKTKLFAEFQNFLVIAQVESFIGWIGYNEFTLDRKGVRYEKNVCFIFDPTCNVSVAREFRAIITIIIARYGSQVFTIHWNKQKKKKNRKLHFH